MVLADSGRIARVPPYLGTPLGQSPVSATGLSPSVARLSRRLAYRGLVLNAVPQPRRSFLRRFGLFPVRSPPLAESKFSFFSSRYLYVSLPSVLSSAPILFGAPSA